MIMISHNLKSPGRLQKGVYQQGIIVCDSALLFNKGLQALISHDGLIPGNHLTAIVTNTCRSARVQLMNVDWLHALHWRNPASAIINHILKVCA
jgi:hypothetical protein